MGAVTKSITIGEELARRLENTPIKLSRVAQEAAEHALAVYEAAQEQNLAARWRKERATEGYKWVQDGKVAGARAACKLSFHEAVTVLQGTDAAAAKEIISRAEYEEELPECTRIGFQKEPWRNGWYEGFIDTIQRTLKEAHGETGIANTE